ncbi:histidinol dehydrogenase [Chloroflexota bacterium]
MRIIEGFESARALLSRQITAESYPVSETLKQGLMKMFGTDDPDQAVRQIVGEVKQRGDAALRDLTLKIDGVKLASLEVDKKEIDDAYQKVDGELVAALELAAERIRDFHTAQKNNIWHEIDEGNLRQLIRPLQRVGIYVPGGTAAYPSTVLMTAVPAKVAGVKEIILVTPPNRYGAVPPVILVAADIAEVDRIFCIGGAQAVAALAYGTKSIPAVDKICGPGNIFVMLAKKQVYGTVDIDGLQGPSEVLIIADETANPEHCAADILAQAEHDALAAVILITTSRLLADRVIQEVDRQSAGLSRKEIIAESLEQGIIAVVGSLDEAIELSNLYAPEHLCLMVENAAAYTDKIANAGCIVLGREATVVLGDYVEGPSHALPTGGTARFSSPLNVSDFIKFINVVTVDETSLKRLGPAASIIARAEGLDAHARAVEKRLKPE